jgi:hypothetical protein
VLLGGLLGLPEALLGGLWTPKTLKNYPSTDPNR